MSGYILGVFNELGKIRWLRPGKTFIYSVITIIAAFVVGILLGSLDSFFSYLLTLATYYL